MNSAAESDPLADLLARPELGERDMALRGDVLARTMPVLRRRRVARRFGVVLACVGCYLAGAVNMQLWDAAGTAEEPRIAHTSAQSRPELKSPGSLEDSSHVGTWQARQAAQLSEQSDYTFQELREAGRDAWRQTRDLETAIRLYAKALEVATPEELAISVDSDDWILMSLKEARSKESHNAGYHDKS